MNVHRIRTIAFIAFAALSAVGSWVVLEGLTEGLLPWVQLGCPGCPEDNPSYPIELLRWHGAEHGALLGVLFAGALVGLLWRTRQRALLLQFYVLGHLVLVAGFLPFRPASTSEGQMIVFCIEVIITLALICPLYPAPRELLNLDGGRSSPRLMWAAAASVVIMGSVALQHLLWQLAGVGGVSASESRWAESVILSVCLISASVMTATPRPGWQALGLITSLAYIYLGIAAIAVPDQSGSWGIPGGIASIAGGLAYAALVFAEARRGAAVATPKPRPATAQV